MQYRVRAEVPKTLVIEIDDFTRGYLECAEWCGLEEEGKEALELSVSPKWSQESLIEAVRECREFQLRNAGYLTESGLDPSQAGHDFWLTRNRHGAGFWDECGAGTGILIRAALRELTEESHMYGERSVAFDESEEELDFY
jgi:hypothetical protein